MYLTIIIILVVIVIIVGIIIWWFWDQSEQAAEDMMEFLLDDLSYMCSDTHEYQIINPKNFSHLDQNFYEQTAHILETKGFVMLGDIEDVTMNEGSFNLERTFIRCLVNSEGTVFANLHEVKLKSLFSFDKRHEKVIDFISELSTGTFLITTNAEISKHISQPSTIIFEYLPQETTEAELLGIHQQRVTEYCEQAQAQSVVIHSLEKLLESFQRFNALTSVHRTSLGGRITKEEAIKIAQEMGDSKYQEMAETFFAEVEKVEAMAQQHCQLFSQMSPPQDWDDHQAWEKYHVLLATDDLLKPDQQDLEIFFEVDDLYQKMQELQAHNCQTIWFPGCGLSQLPKIFAECGFSVHATDISKTAIAFQNQVNVGAIKKQLKKLARRDKSAQPLVLSSGSYECTLHDFRTPYLENHFEVIFNIRALQGFSQESMIKIAQVHYAALKPAGTAYFYTINVFGEHREEIETCLTQSGFFVPGFGIEKWYWQALDDTDFSGISLIGEQPHLKKTGEYLHNPEKWQEDKARLDSIFQEYLAKLQEAHDNIPTDKKIAMIIYATG
jgi:hypothetical protein